MYKSILPTDIIELILYYKKLFEVCEKNNIKKMEKITQNILGQIIIKFKYFDDISYNDFKNELEKKQISYNISNNQLKKIFENTRNNFANMYEYSYFDSDSDY